VSHIDLSQHWHIVARDTGDAVVRLAATELQEALRRITGHSLPLNADRPADQPAITLTHGDAPDDGFCWQATPEAVTLHGHNPRGLLYAVYSLLEALGCRWVAPGAEGERLPRGTRFELPDGPVAETPALPGRCLVLGHHAFLQQAEEWIVWAARNRLNTVFFHVIGGPLAIGAAPSSQYQARQETAVRLARERGMTIEHGGHGLTALLPRKLFRKMPDAFRYHNGRRTPDHNFCPTSAAGLAVVRQNAAAHFRAHPEVDVFHLWADDIAGGGWCACERCRGYTPAEQLLLATNAVAEALAAVNPQAQISFLAYHDTEDLPAQVTPHHNVCVLWAPRKRCYAHATDDPACPVNVPHYETTFRAQATHFQAAGAAPARVFEYYLDAILFKSVLPPLPAVLQRDLRFYRDARAHTIQALMTGDAPWSTPQANAWLFARLAWNPEQDLDGLLSDFCQAVFGADLRTYYRALEAAYALALDLVPEQIRLEFDESLLAMVNDPPADMGDPAYAPPDVLRDKACRNAAILDLLSRAGQALDAAQADSNPDAWAAERAAFDLHRAWLRFDLSRVRLYEVVATQPVAPDARRRLDEAQAALEEVLAWGEAHVADARHRANFRFMRLAFWQGRLDQVRADHVASRVGGWWIKASGLIRIGLLMRRMMGIYEESV